MVIRKVEVRIKNHKTFGIILEMPEEPTARTTPEIESASAETSLLRKKEGWRYPVAILLSIALGIGIFYCIYIYPTIPSFQLNFIGITVPFVPITIVLLGFNLYFFQKANELFMQQIAADLGYTYEEKSQSITTSGTIFAIGYYHNMTDVFSGMYNNLPIRIFTYSYTVGYGKSATTEFANIVSVSFPYTFPHIEFNTQMITEHERLSFEHSDTEPVELEGDFDAQFKLRITKGMQIEIRQLFQPNVMDEIKNSYSDFGFELYENTLYFIHDIFPEEREKWMEYDQRVKKFIDLLLPGLQEISIK